MANILILRFSAIGDVAMTVPVVDSLARQHPENRYTVVSQPFLSPLFANCPDNVEFYGVELKGRHKGIAGIRRLYAELRKNRFDAVADLHDVLRTKLLRLMFRFDGMKVKHIDKGRREKRMFISGKRRHPLKTSTERYADVFRSLNLPVTVVFRSVFGQGKGDISSIEAITGRKKGKWIGIAPFAKHPGKIYPIDRTERVVEYFSAQNDTTLFLFGGGDAEKRLLEEWSARYPRTVSMAGKCRLSDELALISHLEVMLSMDSANMHLASLTATPAVSVWGATHPGVGFYGYRQPSDYAVQRDLPCRPCSIYGNKPCRRKDFACMMQISAEEVIRALEKSMAFLPHS
ncbi:MAG: glycosyltransferase family 9 protein [Bacteroidales bacterium]|jgi:ADP-heptose:LPS heptosyltransferase|nr:glycosyltransferase family 9 protein [Bacteroidales bacterium]